MGPSHGTGEIAQAAEAVAVVEAADAVLARQPGLPRCLIDQVIDLPDCQRSRVALLEGEIDPVVAPRGGGLVRIEDPACQPEARRQVINSLRAPLHAGGTTRKAGVVDREGARDGVDAVMR